VQALVNLNHGLLSALGVSHPSLEMIKSLAMQHGFAAKLTGAGAGGCMLVYVPRSIPSTTLDAFKRAAWEQGFSVYETTLGATGARCYNANHMSLSDFERFSFEELEALSGWEVLAG